VEKEFEHLLREFCRKVEERFRGVVCSFDVPHGYPSPSEYETYIEIFNIPDGQMEAVERFCDELSEALFLSKGYFLVVFITHTKEATELYYKGVVGWNGTKDAARPFYRDIAMWKVLDEGGERCDKKRRIERAA